MAAPGGRRTRSTAQPAHVEGAPALPVILDGKKLKALARAHAATAPARLLAQIDQFASLGRWTAVPPVTTKAWTPPARLVVVDGGITTGKLVIHDGASHHGVVIVLGDVGCTSLDVKSGWTLVCTGDMTATGTITATAGDSVTYVGGVVSARLVKSGTGAWLTLFAGAKALKAPVSSYVMVDGVGPLKNAAR